MKLSRNFKPPIRKLTSLRKRRSRALTRYLVKSSKSSSWKQYVSSINRNTIYLNMDSNIKTSPEVANTLGQMFQENSSKSIYDQEFLSKAYLYNNPTNTVDPIIIFKHTSTHLYSSQNWKKLSVIAKAKVPPLMKFPTYLYKITQPTQGSIYYQYTI